MRHEADLLRKHGSVCRQVSGVSEYKNFEELPELVQTTVYIVNQYPNEINIFKVQCPYL